MDYMFRGSNDAYGNPGSVGHGSEKDYRRTLRLTMLMSFGTDSGRISGDILKAVEDAKKVFEETAHKLQKGFAKIDGTVGNVLRSHRDRILNAVNSMTETDVGEDGDLLAGTIVPAGEHTLMWMRQQRRIRGTGPYSKAGPWYEELGVGKAYHKQRSGFSGRTGGGPSLFDNMEPVDAEGDAMQYGIKFANSNNLMYWQYLTSGTSNRTPMIGRGRISDKLNRAQKDVANDVRRSVIQVIKSTAPWMGWYKENYLD